MDPGKCVNLSLITFLKMLKTDTLASSSMRVAAGCFSEELSVEERNESHKIQLRISGPGAA